MQTDAVAQAEYFLLPVLSKVQHKSTLPTTLIGRLSTTLPASITNDKDDPRPVIFYAISLLQRIHTDLLTKHEPSPRPGEIVSPKARRIIIALLDLLALEGIYPCLTPGLGIPLGRRARVIIPPSKSSNTSSDGVRRLQNLRDVDILGKIISALSDVLKDGKGEVVEMLKDRCLVDLVAGCGELAFNPSQNDRLTIDEKVHWQNCWESLIEGLPTSQLLPLLMSLIHPQCPKWFLAPVTSKLSSIPIHRPNAVRHILQLFLSAPTPVASQSQPSGTPDISLDSLAKAARLLGSVPTFIAPSEWFHVVCPQLIDLVCSEGDESLKRAAAYVVAELLSKKGVEETIEREIVIPILKGLDPEFGKKKSVDQDSYSKNKDSIPFLPNKQKPTSKVLLELENNNENSPMIQTSLSKPLITILPDSNEEMEPTGLTGELQDPPPLVSESTLLNTLSALSFLLKVHPSILIQERLLRPVILPLWGILCFSKERKKNEQWSELPRFLLISCIKRLDTSITIHATSMNDKRPLEQLLYNIGYTGEQSWEFGSGEYGGIEIRQRNANCEKLGMEAVEKRVKEFLALVQDIEISEEGTVVTALFLHIISDWLGVGGGGDGSHKEDPIRVFIRLKILQQILVNQTDKLIKKPTQTLQVIKNIIDEYVSSRQALHEQRIKQQQFISSPSIRGLGKIVDPETSTTTATRPHPVGGTAKRRYIGEDADDKADEKMDETAALASSEDSDSQERITITLSLLSTLIADPETQLTEQDERLLHTLTPSLQFLSTASIDIVDPSVSSLATQIAPFLSLLTPDTLTTSGSNRNINESSELSLIEQQKTTYKTALAYVTDPLVPIRAHGLYLLRLLILARSSILDIPTTLRLLISMIRDPDSFVYLNVVKCLQALSEKHPTTVVQLLVQNYMDDSGTMTLDERLRVGEALLGTVEREGKMLVGEVAQTVAQGMIEAVSRRRRRADKSDGDRGDAVKETIHAMKPRRNPFLDEHSEEAESSGDEDDNGDELDELDEAGNPLPSHAKLTRKHHLHIIRNWLPPPGTQLEDIRIRASALSILSASVETNSLGIGQATCEIAMDISLAILQLETSPEKDILRRAAMVCLASLLKTYDQPGAGWVRGRLNEIKRVAEYIRGLDGDGLVREQAQQVVELVEGVWMEILGGVGGVGGGGVAGDTRYIGGILDQPVIGEIGLEQMGRQRWS